VDKRNIRVALAACLLASGLMGCAGGAPTLQDSSGNRVRIGGIEPGTDPLGEDDASGGASRGPWPHPTGSQRYGQ
jgi:hypothetical protein